MYEDWISYRYLTAKKGRFLSFLNFISIAGVAIGVMALIVVISVMTGFGNNLREKIIGTTPHVMVEKETGVRDFQHLAERIESVEGVEHTSAYIQGNIFLEHAGRAMSLVVRGVDARKEKYITKVDRYLTDGQLVDLHQDSTVMIGKELAGYFGFSLGDQITLIAPGSGIAGEGWRYSLTITGIFKTGMVDYDMNLILVGLSQAQKMFNLDADVVTGIGVRLSDPYNAKMTKQKIYESIGYGFLVKTWIDMNRNLFEALFLEKWGLFIILMLMVVVASFNIISTLIVTVISKVHDIGVLKSIGVPNASIRKIFTNQGIYIGLLGIFWGLVSGLGICYVLANYIEVPQDIYSIDHVPVDIQLFDIVAIIATAMVISFLATIYPARKASQLQPVEALRYE